MCVGQSLSNFHCSKIKTKEREHGDSNNAAGLQNYKMMKYYYLILVLLFNISNIKVLVLEILVL